MTELEKIYILLDLQRQQTEKIVDSLSVVVEMLHKLTLRFLDSERQTQKDQPP